MCLTTYAVVYLFSRYFTLSLTGHRHRRPPWHSQPTDFSFPLATQDDTLTRAMKYLMTHLFGRPCCALPGISSSFPTRLVQFHVSPFDCTVCCKLHCRSPSSVDHQLNSDSIQTTLVLSSHVCHMLFSVSCRISNCPLLILLNKLINTKLFFV